MPGSLLEAVQIPDQSHYLRGESASPEGQSHVHFLILIQERLDEGLLYIEVPKGKVKLTRDSCHEPSTLLQRGWKAEHSAESCQNCVSTVLRFTESQVKRNLRLEAISHVPRCLW